MPPLYKYKKAELIEMVEDLQKENKKLKEDIKLLSSGVEPIEEIKPEHEPEHEEPKITFLFDMIPQDIEDMIIEQKNYMDTKYIKKLLTKRDIRDTIDDEASKYNRRFTNMDKKNIEQLFNVVKYMSEKNVFNPRGLSENLYISYLYKDACVKQEAIKKPDEDLKHKWKVGDILYKINKEYSEPTQFWRVVKLTKKSYTLEWVQNKEWSENDGYWVHYYTEVDLDNLVAPVRYKKWGDWINVKKATNVKEDNYYLVEDLMKPDNKHKYLITVEGRKVKSNYYSYDRMR